jgi:hypothetical protein
VIARDRRALRAGAVAVVALFGVLRVAPWAVTEVRRFRHAAADRVALAERARAMVAAAPQARDSLRQALADVVALAPALIEGTSHADAAATLVSWVAGAAGANALRMNRVESVAGTAGTLPRAVAVRAELEGDIAGVTGFLRDVETRAPLLTARELALTALDPATPATAPEVLRLELAIAGWYWPGAER